MNIYFAGSITGGRGDQGIYMEIVKLLAKHGKVLTEHVADSKLSSYGEAHILSAEQIYTRDVEWLSQSDVIIAETTVTSLGVGYELGRAESLGKNILCLYRQQEGKRLSSMITGNKNIIVQYYKEVGELPAIFEKYFNKIKILA